MEYLIFIIILSLVVFCYQRAIKLKNSEIYYLKSEIKDKDLDIKILSIH